MVGLREARELVLLGHNQGFLDDLEFALLYDLNNSKNPDFPYWNYAPFELENVSEADCWADFRFNRNDIYRLANVLHLPNHIICYNGTKANKIEGLCILLKRFAYPCRYGDMIPRFGRSVPELSMITNTVLNIIYENYNHKLRTLDQPWLAPEKLREYADAIQRKGAALNFCWGFIDGTVRPICRPNQNQRIVYNGHKRVHALKFQSVVAPNGLIANMFGPMEGRRHDSGMLRESGLLDDLEIHSMDQFGHNLCIYGDPAYPIRPQLMCPFRGAALTNEQQNFNTAMSKVRVSVEWIFNDIINYYKFLDFKKNLKIGLSSIGKMYLVCALLHNARACLYRNNTSTFFDVEAPSLEEYFI